MILSLADYKALRGIKDDDRDVQLALALEGADDVIKWATGIDFTEATGPESREFSYNGSGILITDYFTELVAVAIDGQTLGSEFYVPGPPSGPPFCQIDLGARAPSPLMGFRRNLDTTNWSHGRSRVTVTASWGWPGGAPGNVKMAAAMLVDEFAPAEDGDSQGLAAKSIESYSVVYTNSSEAKELPPQVRQLLEPFTRPRF